MTDTRVEYESRFLGGALVAAVKGQARTYLHLAADEEGLQPAHFNSSLHERIYAAMLGSVEDDEPITLLDLCRRLQNGDAEENGRLGRKLAELADCAATTAYGQSDARQIRAQAERAERVALHQRLAQDPADQQARARLHVLDELHAERHVGLVTVEEFEGDPTPEPIVEGMIFKASTHIDTGASKSGKTWKAIQLAICTAHGLPFLDLPTQQTPVLLLSLEMTVAMVRDRMRAISADVGLPEMEIGENFQLVAPTVDRVPVLDLTTDTGVAEIGDLIERTRAGLVIFDTLYRFLPGVDPNSNQEMGTVFGRLNDLAQSTGAALLLLDHVAKGEHLGPVSHSALGASVKGGASRVVIALKRTSKEDGGRWELNVESHFGNWEQPIHYERPLRDDQTRGHGCVLCGAAEAWGLGLEAVRELFERLGGPDDQLRPTFPSKRKLIEALIQAGHASGNADGSSIVSAILRDYCMPKGSTWRDQTRPIVTAEGKRGATVFSWRADV